jgi:hypothetical protein
MRATRAVWACFVLGLAAAASLVEACATGEIAGLDASCSGTSCNGNDGGNGSDVVTDGGPDGGCASPETACYPPDGGKAACINTKTDSNHCGSCTNACIPQLEACDGGVCMSTCAAPQTLCIPDGGPVDGGDASVGPHCADLQTSQNDCGNCGNTCGVGFTCDAGGCYCPITTGSQAFSYTGSQQTFTVPQCVTSVTITALGAQGANANDKLSTAHTGGKGGTALGTLAVMPGETLYVNVGGQGSASGTGGWNGGATAGTSTVGCSGGPAGGGGGMSDVRQGGTALSNIVIAGAGGGGSGRDYCYGTCQPCGCGGGNGGGGGATGTAGGSAYNCGYGYPGSGVNGGGGGTQTGGGAGGTGDGSGASGTSGTQGSGGGGAAGAYDVAGGGGGGGYYGGGGGGGASSGSGVGGGGGGGGSSYIGGVTAASTTAATQSGNGQVTITW